LWLCNKLHTDSQRHLLSPSRTTTEFINKKLPSQLTKHLQLRDNSDETRSKYRQYRARHQDQDGEIEICL